MQFTLPKSSKKKNTLHANHPCTLCETHGNYSHHCPHLPHICDMLIILRKIHAARKGIYTPLHTTCDTSSMLGKGANPLIIEIGPLDVEMTREHHTYALPIIIYGIDTFIPPESVSLCIFEHTFYVWRCFGLNIGGTSVHKSLVYLFRCRASE